MPISGYTTNKNLSKIAAGSTDNWDVWLNGDLDILDEPSILYQISAAENISAGYVAVIKDDGTGAKRAYLATFANYTFGDPVGVATETVTAPGPVRLVMAGRITDTGYSFGATDALAYLSATGAVTATPTATKIGFVLSATSFFLVPTGVGKTDTVSGTNGATNSGDDINAVIEPVYGATANTVAEGNHTHTFPALTDSPSSYVSQGGKVVRVNNAESAVEFASPGGVGAYATLTARPDATNPAYQVDVFAEALTVVDSSGGLLQALSVAVTGDITATGANGRDVAVAEKTSEHYAIYVIGKSDGTIASLLKQWTESGTTDGTTASKLIDSAATFSADGLVKAGDTVVNQTDGTETTVTAIDSDTTLSLAADIFTTGEDYRIVLGREPTLPTGYTYRRRVGSVYNNSSGNFREFRQSGGRVWVNDYISNGYLSAGSSSSYALVTPETPPSAMIAKIIVQANASSAGIIFSFDGTIASNRLELASGWFYPAEVCIENGGHYYKYAWGSGTIDLYLCGYEDNL